MAIHDGALLAQLSPLPPSSTQVLLSPELWNLLLLQLDSAQEPEQLTLAISSRFAVPSAPSDAGKHLKSLVVHARKAEGDLGEVSLPPLRFAAVCRR
jgi:hypothetical protein